ncbi:MAG: carboxymuconolactone decarboxylase family protein [Pseudomonadota bacterium]
MADFTLHDKTTDNDERRATLATVEENYGFIPNLFAGLAEAPATVRGYMALSKEVGQSSFSPTERHVAWFAVNYFHNCHYCMPAHTAMAKMEKIDDAVIEAARSGGGYNNKHLQILHDFVTEMTAHRGNIDEKRIDQFLDAGFTRQHVLEIVLIIAHKTISNYANHLLQTPVDDRFAAFAWQKDA